jgi:NADH-quinone oxidoreductase subunit L
MTIPLMVLAVLSVFGGFIGVPEVLGGSYRLAQFLDPIYEGSKTIMPEFGSAHLDHSKELMLMSISVIAAGISIAIAYFRYRNGKNIPVEDAEMSGIPKLVYNKYYIDEVYWAMFVSPIKHLSLLFSYIVEPKGFDGIVNGVADSISSLGSRVRRLQTGNTGFYLFAMVIGIVIILAINIGFDVIESLKGFSK